MKRALTFALAAAGLALLVYLIGAFVTWNWWWPPEVSPEVRATIAIPPVILAFWTAFYVWFFEQKGK